VGRVPSYKCAVVVGNDYTTVDKLPSCAKDAKDVHDTLTKYVLCIIYIFLLVLF
jgi:hypothetical protein